MTTVCSRAYFMSLLLSLTNAAERKEQPSLLSQGPRKQEARRTMILSRDQIVGKGEKDKLIHVMAAVQ